MTRKKIIIGILLFVGIVGIASTTIEIKQRLSGSVTLNNMNLINELGEIGLGDYIFLMSPSPNEGEEGNVQALSEWGSYLVVTNQDYEIQKTIKVDKYYDQITLSSDFDIVLHNSTSKDQATSVNSSGGYGNFEKSSKKLENDEEPYIVLGNNEITLISDQQVVILDDPYFISENHEFFIVDFIQNIKH